MIYRTVRPCTRQPRKLLGNAQPAPDSFRELGMGVNRGGTCRDGQRPDRGWIPYTRTCMKGRRRTLELPRLPSRSPAWQRCDSAAGRLAKVVVGTTPRGGEVCSLPTALRERWRRN